MIPFSFRTVLLICLAFVVAQAVPEFYVWFKWHYALPCWCLAVTNIAWAILVLALVYGGTS